MEFTLFVGRDSLNTFRHDVGSTLCLSMLDRMSGAPVTVELANDIPPRERPYWLKGTPILVNNSSGERFTGFSAYNTITNMAFEEARKRDAGKGNISAKKGTIAEPTRQKGQTIQETADEEGGMDSMFVSDFQNVDMESGKEAKLTSDDLAAALRAREGPSNNDPPAGEMLKD